MSINIYDKATIVKKDNIYYYFLKNGSKNSFTCPYQTIPDDNFNNKFIKKQSRDSDWHIIAFGDKNNIINDDIAKTCYNSPKFYMYGNIRFDNKNNVALYFVKNKDKILDYDLLNETQKANIDNNIKYYSDEAKNYVIDLNNIQEEDKMKNEHNYCDKNYNLSDYQLLYNNIAFWNCDHL